MHVKDDGEGAVRAGQRLGHGQDAAKSDGRGKNGGGREVHRFKARPHDDQNAGKPHHDGQCADPGHAFPEKKRRQDRGPDRHRELDRDHLGEGQEADRQKPAILRAEMKRITGEMHAEPVGPKRRPSDRHPNRKDQGQADNASEEHDLKGRDLRGEFPAPDRHERQRHHPGQHPHGGLEYVLSRLECFFGGGHRAGLDVCARGGKAAQPRPAENRLTSEALARMLRPL